MRLSAILACAALALVPGASAVARPKPPASPPPPAPASSKSTSDDLEIEAPPPAPADLPIPDEVEAQKPAEKPAAAPTPAPAAVAPAQAPVLPPPAAPAPFKPFFRLTPAVGFGSVGEAQLGSSASVFTAGLSAELFFKEPMSLTLHLADRFYQRLYATNQPDLSGRGAAQLTLDEQELAGDLLFAYDLAGAIGLGEKGSLAPMIGPSFRSFYNEALRANAGAIAVGARGGYALSEMLDVSAGVLYGYNLFFKNTDLASALGGPKAVTSLEGAVGLKLAPHTRLRLGYEGEVVTLQSSYRLLHTLLFSFDVLL